MDGSSLDTLGKTIGRGRGVSGFSFGLCFSFVERTAFFGIFNADVTGPICPHGMLVVFDSEGVTFVSDTAGGAASL